VQLNIGDNIKYHLWALSPLIIIPVAFRITRKYFGLTFRDTVWHYAFAVSAGLLTVGSGLILRILPIPWLSDVLPNAYVYLVILGFVWMTSPLLRWALAPQLPVDRTVICVAPFAPIGNAAVNDAEVISDRIWEILTAKRAEGVPIEVKRAFLAIREVDEDTAKRKAAKLAKSRENKSHIVISGDVRIDGSEILVRPRVTFAKGAFPSTRDPDILPFCDDGTDTITFKRRVSSEISDVTLFACAAAYFRNHDLDACVALLSGASGNELLLLRAIALLKKAQDQ
jgi:hypothetical protein